MVLPFPVNVYGRVFVTKPVAQSPRICEGCRETFTPQRDDARWCSSRCRAAYWRQIQHRRLVKANPGELCHHQFDPETRCELPAVVVELSTSNRYKSHVGGTHRCQEHQPTRPVGCDPDCGAGRGGCPLDPAEVQYRSRPASQ